jgi:hypothetical protein
MATGEEVGRPPYDLVITETRVDVDVVVVARTPVVAHEMPQEIPAVAARILLYFGHLPDRPLWKSGTQAQFTEGAVMAPLSLIDRVRGEFIEMPGLQLTIAQAARLWGLEVQACRHVIDALVESAFLRWTPNGKITRAAA